MTHPTTKRVLFAGIRTTLYIITSFLFGLALASTFFLWNAIHSIETPTASSSLGFTPLSPAIINFRNGNASDRNSNSFVNDTTISETSVSVNEKEEATNLLSGLRILVTIVSFDFMQLAHLEEVLDGFQDVCYAGSKVDVVVYTTVVVSQVVFHSNSLYCL